MEDRLVMSRCHEYDGPDFVPEPEVYAKARDRDAATGTKIHRFEAAKFYKKTKAIERKREKDSFIPEKGNYYVPVNWSPGERQALAQLRDDPGGASVHHGTNSGRSRVAGLYGERDWI